MKLGTATITREDHGDHPVYVVRWMNVGNFLQNEPRVFWSAVHAEEWISERGLKLVAR